ncbi:MAG TPA: beta-ketoacyl synthase N-terminal-like domain-containing protein [Myxococcaceae bacterium]|jgi:3-oxoacyl-[acyl-carrier-protein] synthase II
MTAPRVVVTGMGVVSPLAVGREVHLQRLLRGESAAVATAPEVARRSGCVLEARIPGFDRQTAIANRMLRKLLTTSAAFSVVAAGEALRDAGFKSGDATLSGMGVFAGSVCIDFNPEMFIPAMRESLSPEGELDIHRFAKKGMQLIDPLFIVKTLPNGGVGGIAIEHQTTGPSLNITNGPVSGLQAVAAAARAIRGGEVEVALAGAYDSMLNMDSIAEHLVAGRLSTETENPARACRPFDVRRAGYVLGEGAVFFVLESLEHARERSARAWGEILGAGQAMSPAAPSAAEETGGLLDAAHKALAMASCAPDQVDVLFGDGLGVEADDLLESESARGLFGARRVAFTAATGSTGFAGAAGGAMSLMHALSAAKSGAVPPMIGCGQVDPRCSMDLVLQAREQVVKRALVWNSDRGVKNAAVLVGPAPA